MKTWNSYYQKRPLDISNILLHWQYLMRVLWIRPKRLLEIGCGRAQHSLLIKNLLPCVEIYLIDKDRELLNKTIKRNKNKITGYWIGDVTQMENALPYFDLVISQGLVEHFSQKEIISMIESFRQHCQRMLISIPSSVYPTKDFGNEILRSKTDLKKIFNKIKNIKYFIVPYLDIGYRTKLLKCRLNKFGLLKTVQCLLFESNHFLIEIIYNSHNENKI